MMTDQNPLDPVQLLKRPLDGEQLEEAHTLQPVLPEDSAATKAEKVERNGTIENSDVEDSAEPATKRIKLDQPQQQAPRTNTREKVKGLALIKEE
jgi:tRNA-dihydrouridine synthase 3